MVAISAPVNALVKFHLRSLVSSGYSLGIEIPLCSFADSLKSSAMLWIFPVLCNSTRANMIMADSCSSPEDLAMLPSPSTILLKRPCSCGCDPDSTSCGGRDAGSFPACWCSCCFFSDHQPKAPAEAPRTPPPITKTASEIIGAAWRTCLLLLTSSCVYNHQIQRTTGINQSRATTSSGTDSNHPLKILSSNATVSIVPATGGISFRTVTGLYSTHCVRYIIPH